MQKTIAIFLLCAAINTKNMEIIKGYDSLTYCYTYEKEKLCKMATSEKLETCRILLKSSLFIAERIKFDKIDNAEDDFIYNDRLFLEPKKFSNEYFSNFYYDGVIDNISLEWQENILLKLYDLEQKKEQSMTEAMLTVHMFLFDLGITSSRHYLENETIILDDDSLKQGVSSLQYFLSTIGWRHMSRKIKTATTRAQNAIARYHRSSPYSEPKDYLQLFDSVNTTYIEQPEFEWLPNWYKEQTNYAQEANAITAVFTGQSPI